MKSITCICMAVLIFLNGHAQNIFSARTSSFSKAFAEVLLDYPNNFHNISGELILSQGEYEHYASLISLPGSKSCIIGRYHSVADSTASWQAVMYSHEEFEIAAKEYRNIFRQLKASPVTLVDGSKIFLVGEMPELDESLDFTIATFIFPTADMRYRNFKVELEMLYSMHEWVINLNLVRRKKDEEKTW